jgi:O-antigen ligase
MIKDHPLSGIGLANFKVAYPFYRSPKAFYQGEIYAHNSYLELWAEVGSIGFALLLLLVLRTISNYRLSLRRLKDDKDKYYLCIGFFLATIANFLQAFFFSFEHLKYFWAWIAFSYVWRNISES